eukprot:CAMPEP_0185731690 /NCGR_PEP_ID=MMETSP1171-20130828/13759_1 /TAXON_ID=374046 /ORGANISM="Helicotheca tamensis, Strain CCMP826" /LENGTH=408 /DNA_ID=CAMNT_0028401005 /DNA_START=124 /DNA_END=1350 /DNA_ORIENTATION=-
MPPQFSKNEENEQPVEIRDEKIMCKPDNTAEHPKQSYMRQRSNANVNNGNKNVTIQNEKGQRQDSNIESYAKNASQSNEGNSLYFNLPFSLLLTYGSLEFAQWFPYVLAPQAAVATYVPASWRYDEFETRFDNSIWTWGTDYGLCVIFSYAAYKCYTAYKSEDSAEGRAASARLRILSAAMMALYAISVFAGGWAHQFFTTLDSLNTTEFRIIWTICVGTVTAAGGLMGAIGSEVSRSFRPGSRLASRELFSPPAFPGWFWAVWAIYMTSACAIGSISFKRPACDIFIAGTTQFVPTVHAISSLFVRYFREKKREEKQKDGNSSGEVLRLYRVLYYVGFAFNSPLLPAYPLLVQYTSLSLGSVNTLLHAWLLAGWGMQAIGLFHLSSVLSSSGAKTDMTTPSSSFSTL